MQGLVANIEPKRSREPWDSGRTRGRRRFLPAVTLAILAHGLALLALGWRIPMAPPPPPDTLSPVDIRLVPPLTAKVAAPAGAAARRASQSPSASASLVRPSQPDQPAPPAADAEPQAPSLAEGAPDCAVEDLPLLTDTEKARCRDQIDADRARRLARGADQRAAKQVAEAQRMPSTYRMDPGKEAYYAAVAQAYWQQSSHGPPMAGHPPMPVCMLPGIPFLGGVEINKNKLAKKKKEPRPPHSLKLGPLPCYLVPPQGLFTEESSLDPLDPQWLSKPPPDRP